MYIFGDHIADVVHLRIMTNKKMNQKKNHKLEEDEEESREW